MRLAHRYTSLAASAVLAVGALGLAACGDDDSDDGSVDATENDAENGVEAPDDALSISASDFEFSTDSLSADAGEVTVVFTNDDGAPHSFTIDDLNVDIDVSGGSSDSATFTAEPGVYEYYCTYHGTMQGTLEVN
ncbi:MAG: cupredoxin domain-containing protein [Acidimicrobiia bacterium]|nr:cupredoxin domain-containing protein [Acidimicrobiia bacterium]